MGFGTTGEGDRGRSPARISRPRRGAVATPPEPRTDDTPLVADQSDGAGTRGAVPEIKRELDQLSRHVAALAELVQSHFDEASARGEIGEQLTLDQLTKAFERLSADLTDRFEATVNEKVQRLEALTQAAMTLVGEPLDELTQKVTQLGRARENAVTTLESIGELGNLRALLAAVIEDHRQEIAEHQQLLQRLLERLDRLSG